MCLDECMTYRRVYIRMSLHRCIISRRVGIEMCSDECMTYRRVCIKISLHRCMTCRRVAMNMCVHQDKHHLCCMYRYTMCGVWCGLDNGS